MNTKNADRKQQEWLECVWLLVEAGADVDAAAFCGEDEEDEYEEDDYVDQGDVPLEAAVGNGLLIGAQVCLERQGGTAHQRPHGPLGVQAAPHGPLPHSQARGN